MSRATPKSVYDDLVNKNIIDPLLSQKEFNHLQKSNSLDLITDSELLSIAMQSKSAIRHEHSFETFYPEFSTEAPWTVGRVAELARIRIPSGMLGVLNRIDTLIIDATTGEPLNEWDNPNSWDNIFDFAICHNNGRFKMPAFRVSSPSAVPASAYWTRLAGTMPLWPLGVIPDNRYAWGNPSNEMGVLLPKDQWVRLFAICKKESIQPHKLKGRLTYTIQLEQSLSAAWRARRGDIR